MPDAMELPHISVWELICYRSKIFLARLVLLNQAMNINAFPQFLLDELRNSILEILSPDFVRQISFKV
jgi:hypothetical protein